MARARRVHHALCAWIALVPTALSLSPRGDAATEAEELYRDAEEQYAKGRYKKAYQLFEKVAEKYGDTDLGHEASERCQPTGYLGWAEMVRNGPSSNRIDVVVMAEGYELDKQKAFDSDADDVHDVFERHPVLGEYFAYHNFLRVNLVSVDAQVDLEGREYDTALDADGEWGEVDQELVRKYLAHVPEHDDLVVACVKGSRWGWAEGIVASIPARNEPMLLHTWGHVFAGLAEEAEDGRGCGAPIHNTPNVAHSADVAYVPWKAWIDASVPGVGVYEGAACTVHGAWKSTNNCLMANYGRDFCPICREALLLAIYSRVDPIDGCTPEAHPLAGEGLESLELSQPLAFSVEVLCPKKHPLEVRWWVLPEAQAPVAPTPSTEFTDRRARGPLARIGVEPTEEPPFKKGQRAYEFELEPGDLVPGRYRVVCRVVDPVQARGDRFPWVLSDPHGVLASERAWWVVVP